MKKAATNAVPLAEAACVQAGVPYEFWWGNQGCN